MPLSERAYAWVLREAAAAEQEPDAWLDAWISRQLNGLRLKSEVAGMFQDLMS